MVCAGDAGAGRGGCSIRATIAALVIVGFHPERCATAPVVEKLHFSCVPAECLPQAMMQREQVILCGIECHVCVLQTALDLLASGKQVFVVADATSSRTAENHLAALQRMAAAGVQVVTREMVVFELLRSASHEQFRVISKAFLAGEQP
nr:MULTISPECIES: isochorismatase family protein [Pseudomonas]